MTNTELFRLQVPAQELILRGTVMYWFLFLMFRLRRRDSGSIGLADVLVVVIIADAAQNAMAGEYKTISEGMVLVSTIFFWNWLIDWVAFRFPRMQKLLEPSTVSLVNQGRVNFRTLRREMITIDELTSQARQNGIESLSAVKTAYLEADGHISIIPYQRNDAHRRRESSPGA